LSLAVWVGRLGGRLFVAANEAQLPQSQHSPDEKGILCFADDAPVTIAPPVGVVVRQSFVVFFSLHFEIGRTP